MIRNLLFLLLLCTCPMKGLAYGQCIGVRDAGRIDTLRVLTMSELWAQMPDEVLPLLGQRERLDAYDYLKSGMKAEVSNALQGKSMLEPLTPRFVQVRLTPSSLWQARLLSLPTGEEIVAVVHTVGDKVQVSNLSFYTTTWQPLDALRYMSDALMHDVAQGQGSLVLNDTTEELTAVFPVMVVDANAQLNDSLFSKVYVWSEGRFVASDSKN